MKQPNFWLRITQSYVIENFDSLLTYVSQYHYSPAEPSDSDFNSTVDHLSKAALSLIEVAEKGNMDVVPQWDIPTSKVLRIVGTAIVAERKRGHSFYELLIGLVRILCSIGAIKSDYTAAYVNLLNACARRLKPKNLPFGFSEFVDTVFSVHTLAMRLPMIEWFPDEEVKAYWEGKGTVLFSNEGVKLIPLNYEEISKSSVKIKKIFEPNINIWIEDKESKKIDSEDVSDIFKVTPTLLRLLQKIRPSKEKRKLTYSEGDYVDVRITNKYGIRLEAESIDPDYERVKGKLLLEGINLGIPRDYLLNNLKIGDILPVRYFPEEDCAFRISDDSEEELDFKNTIKDEYSHYVRAVYCQDYAFGSRWLTEVGIQVNVLKKFENNIDFSEHNSEGSCLKIKINEVKSDSRGNIVINGEYLPECEQDEPDVDPAIFEREAYNNLSRLFLNYMKDGYDEEIVPSPSTHEFKIGDKVVRTLACVLLQSVISGKGLSSSDKVCHIFLSMLLFESTGDEVNLSVASRELSFIKAAIDFASGKSPMSLSLYIDPAIAQAERSVVLEKIVNTLKTYKESHYSISVSEKLIGEQYDQIEDLVNSSNTLIGKLDSSELSRIKKSIARHLGVVDSFREAQSDYSHFGNESDTLEFKISCVTPPQNRRTGTLSGDLKMQAYIILKTVCAFLNSPSGGDLLIGVNDNGYGVGVSADLDVLYDNKFIPERSADRLRIYIKNILDQGFITYDGSIVGNAITVGQVWVNVEETKNGKDIIRVKVTPYPYNVIRIHPDKVPEKCGDVFYRTSGSSEPLNSAGVRNARLVKLSKLDPNESKIATILEAIDRKKQLKIREYHSSSGIGDKRIEPHYLMPDNSTLQGFDLVAREMRLFKLSRMGEVEMMTSNWEAEKKHHTLAVDVFGMNQSDAYPGKLVHVKMTDYALLLLFEEFPNTKNCEHFNIKENQESDSRKYPFIAEMMIYNPWGLYRFIRGLSEHTLLIEENL